MSKEAGAKDQVFNGGEEFPIEMRDILEKMADEVTDGFFWLEVLLAAACTEAFFDGCAAIEAGLIVTKVVAAHVFFLKIRKKLIDRLLLHAFEVPFGAFVISDLGAGAAGQAFYFHDLIREVAE